MERKATEGRTMRPLSNPSSTRSVVFQPGGTLFTRPDPDSHQFAGCKIIFFDAGTYIVKSTLTIPAGAHIVGEAWATIVGRGHAFADMEKPTPVIRVGEPDSQGIIEISDMLFGTVGPGWSYIHFEHG